MTELPFVENYTDEYATNKYGVQGQYRSGRFIPEVCLWCSNRDWDSIDEYHPPSYYCCKNIWFPVRKGTCKKAITAGGNEE